MLNDLFCSKAKLLFGHGFYNPINSPSCPPLGQAGERLTGNQLDSKIAAMADHLNCRALGVRLMFVLFAMGLWSPAAVAVDIPEEVAKQKPFHETWAEEVPVMGHLAVAKDGTVLIFKENREKGRGDVKRSEDGGRTWSQPINIGKRVKINADMSDDGRYRGEHVGWSELTNVTIDENTGDIMVFAAGLKPAEVLYRSRDHGKTWATEKIVIKADNNGWQGTTYCCDSGITLRHGKHKGRLLMPSQVFVGSINKDGSRTYLNKGQGR